MKMVREMCSRRSLVGTGVAKLESKAMEQARNIKGCQLQTIEQGSGVHPLRIASLHKQLGEKQTHEW